MKKGILMLLMVIFSAVSLTSCKNAIKDETKSEGVALAAYQCPMKCEGDKTYTDKDQKCPVCGMGLKEVAHEDDHSGHEH